MKMIRGVLPAMVTPFDEREQPDEARARNVARFLKEQGVAGLYLTGSTGEGFVQSPEERKAFVEIVADELKGELPFIVHVGAIGTKISIDLARHAEKAGAAAVSSVPPFYWKFGEANIIKYYTELAGSVGIPTIIYNIALAGVMNFDTILKLTRIPGVEGIKYTAPTQFEMMRLRQETDEGFEIFSGSDEMAMSGLSFGADGIIGTFYNVMPDLFTELYRAWEQKDLLKMQAKQKLANEIIMTTLKHDMIPTVKMMMRWMGVDAGIARSPFTRYTEAEEAAIREEYKAFKDRPGADAVQFLRKV